MKITKYKSGNMFRFHKNIGDLIDLKKFSLKILVTLLSLVLHFQTALGQNSPDPIRLVFNQYASKQAGKEWADWEQGQNIFIVFYNDNGDIMHYKSGGGQELYLRRTNWESGIGLNGAEYIYADFILENGTLVTVQVYTKPRVLVKVVIGDGALVVQFDNS
jgi:hypothetical protein